MIITAAEFDFAAYQSGKWGDHLIIHGDCRDVLPKIDNKAIDLIVTDPPYGIKMDEGFEGFGGFRGFGTPIARRQYEDDWDAERPTKETFDEIIRVGKSCLIFGGNFFSDILPQGKHWLSWDKKNTMPSFGDCELVWTNIDRKSVKKYVYEWNGLIGKEQHRWHPTQKPRLLIEALIRDYIKKGTLIADFYLGAGTTLLAAKNLGFKAIGVEKSLHYAQVAEQRLAQEVLAL